jgi:NAD-dependent SIR2 family protein deacetylase
LWAYYASFVEYRCSQCHHAFATQGDAEAEVCPNCKAEAGLEPQAGIPFPMKAFGLILGGAIVLAVVGTALSLGAGS